MSLCKASASILLMLASTACGERDCQPGNDLCVARTETLECGSVRVGTLASCSALVRNETGRSIELRAPQATCASESVRLDVLSLDSGASTLLHYKAFAIAPGRGLVAEPTAGQKRLAALHMAPFEARPQNGRPPPTVIRFPE